jgi:hypothetical protein
MGTPDDFNFEIGQDSGESFPENHSLIASVCKDTCRTGSTEPGYHHRDLGYRPEDDGVKQQTERVSENRAFLAFDFLACIIAMRIDAGPLVLRSSRFGYR